MSTAITLSIFPSLTASVPEATLSLDWPQVAELLTSRHHGADSKEAVKLFGPYRLRENGRRRNADVVEISALTADIDDGTPPREVAQRLEARGLTYALYTTYTHSPQKPRYRVIVPLARPLPADRWSAFFRLACRLLRLPVDPQTADAARIYFFPSCPPEALPYAERWWRSGQPLDPQQILLEATESFQVGERDPFSLPEQIGSGVRNDTLHRYAWHLLAREEATTEEALAERLLQANRERCRPPLPNREVRAIAHSAWTHFIERRAQELAQRTATAEADEEATDEEDTQAPPMATQYPPEVEAYLEQMNRELAYVRSLSAIWRASVRALAPVEKVRHDYANVLFQVRRRRNARAENAFDLWLRWRHRREYNAIEFAPGEPPTTAAGNLNLWSGWPQEPRPGDVSLWHRLLDHIFGDDIEARRWFECWAAYPIKYPGTKLYTACIFWSAIEGSGKTSLGLLLASLYGAHARVIHGGELGLRFNSWAKDAAFVVGEEVRAEDQRVDADKLKHLITGETIPVEQKFVDRYELPNRMNFIFLSNHPNAFYITEFSRRYFVWEIASGKLPLALGEALERWRKSPEGRGALMHYFLNLDLSQWSPRAEALPTRAREEMIEMSRSELERWLADIIEDAEVVRLEDLKAQYELDTRSRVSSSAIAHIVRRMAPAMVRRRLRIGGRRTWLWAIRDPRKWEQAPAEAWRDAYERWLRGRLQT